MGKVSQPEHKEFFWLVSALLLSLGILGLIFAIVPFIIIFIFSSFIFIFIAVVYLLEFWDSKPEKLLKRRPGVSVIVSAFNSSQTIERSLDSILAMDYPKKVPVFVVEDASTDDTFTKLKKYSKRITIIRNKENQGKAASINQALKRIKTDYVACIDSDTFPNKNALEKMMPHFTARNVGAVIALICVDKARNFVQKIQQVEYYVSFGFWHTALAQLDSLLVTPGPMSVYSMEALRKVGGFDEGNITEDMEIALHLQSEGYRIKCTTDAKVYTEVPDSWRKLYKQRLRWLRGKIFNGWTYSGMLFNAKHGDFGKFAYPASFVNELLGVVVVTRVLLLYATKSFNVFLGAIGLAAVDASLLYDLSIYSNSVLNSSFLFFVFTLLLWAYIVIVSFKLANEKIHWAHVPAAIAYMAFYAMFISLVYFSSILHEAVGAERKW